MNAFYSSERGNVFTVAHNSIELLDIIQTFIRSQIVLSPRRFDELLHPSNAYDLSTGLSSPKEVQDHEPFFIGVGLAPEYEDWKGSGTSLQFCS